MIGSEESESQTLPPREIIGDERRFKQVLINLVKNAFKFTIKGQIEIDANYDYSSQYLKVQVTDTGIGISEEDQPKLFKKFGTLARTA